MLQHPRPQTARHRGGRVRAHRRRGLAERIDSYTRLGHLTGAVHGLNYKLAAPLAAIGLRRLRHLDEHLRARRANASRLRAALPAGGALTELAHAPTDTPNYYNLVLTAAAGSADPAAAGFAAAGLPPDSARYGYQPLYHQPIFAAYATPCPNAEALTAQALQLPVHPGMSKAALQWVANRIQVLAEGQQRP